VTPRKTASLNIFGMTSSDTFQSNEIARPCSSVLDLKDDVREAPDRATLLDETTLTSYWQVAIKTLH
jgi:hypothetical protein